MSSGELISAADIEKFGYCPLSWWLSRGKAPEEGAEIVAGEKEHSRVSEDLLGIETHETTAREAETGVMYFAIAATIIATVGVTFVVDLSVEIARLQGGTPSGVRTRHCQPLRQRRTEPLTGSALPSP